MADSREQILAAPQNLSDLRRVQSRLFQTSDQTACFHAVYSTLQSMGYGIDKADESVGLITATDLNNLDRHVTVTVISEMPGQTRIRLNGERRLGPITDRNYYQGFFDQLAQQLSLKALG